MEKPLKEEQEATRRRPPPTIRVQDSSATRMLHDGPLTADPFRQQSVASRFKSSPSSFMSYSRFSKSSRSGMTSSLTFSEGLCNFHTSDDPDDGSSLASSSSVEFSPSFSLQGIGSGALAAFESIKNLKGALLLDSVKSRQKRLERKKRPKPLTLSVSLTKTQTIRLLDDFKPSEEHYEPQSGRKRPPNPFLAAFKSRNDTLKARMPSPEHPPPSAGFRAKRRVSLPTEDIFSKLAASINGDPQVKRSLEDSTVSFGSGLYLLARHGVAVKKRASPISLVPQ